MSNRVKFKRKKSIFFVAWGGFIFKQYFYCQALQKPTVAWFMPLDDAIHVLQEQVYVSREKKGAESMLKAIKRDCEIKPVHDPGMSIGMVQMMVEMFPPQDYELSVIECEGISYEEYKELENMAEQEPCRALYGTAFGSFRNFASRRYNEVYQQLPLPPDYFTPPVDPRRASYPYQIAGALPPEHLRRPETITLKEMRRRWEKLKEMRRKERGSSSLTLERKMFEIEKTITGDLVRMPRRIDWDDFDI